MKLPLLLGCKVFKKSQVSFYERIYYFEFNYTYRSSTQAKLNKNGLETLLAIKKSHTKNTLPRNCNRYSPGTPINSAHAVYPDTTE